MRWILRLTSPVGVACNSADRVHVMMKKKKKKESKKMLEQITSSRGDEEKEESNKSKRDIRTPAQKAFDKIQEQRQMVRILDKASKKHKERVNEFNAKLDTLTEHFDIPKVSWTK